MNNNTGYKTVSFHMVHRQLDPTNWHDYLTPDEFEQLKQSKKSEEQKKSPKTKVQDPPKLPQSPKNIPPETQNQPQLPQQSPPAEIKPYVPDNAKILSATGNVIHNGLFEEELSNWTKIEKNKGKVTIVDTKKNILIGKKTVKLSLPEHAYSALAGINQEITLVPNTFYFIELSTKTDLATLAPILYLHIGNQRFKLHCQPHYASYRILFNSRSSTQTKLQIDTGYKFSTASSTYFIDNILLYPQ